VISSVFVDAGVLLACFDDCDLARRDAARAWIARCWERRCGRLSTQVLSEFYSRARATFPSPMAAGDARAEIRRYQHWQPWALDHPTLETAWAIESRYGIDHWDALIVASAQAQGCGCVLTEELPHEQQIDGVRIVNPFVVGPETLEATA
jgi:predicted nucleic acid-binding protein